MDLWNKIFFSKQKVESRKQKGSKCHEPFLASSHCHGYELFRLVGERDVRVVVFRDCDRRGRKILYDSQTVVRSPLKEPLQTPSSAEGFPSSAKYSSSCGSSACRSKQWAKKDDGGLFLEVRNGFGYQYLKECPETKIIGEYVFGAVAMAYNGPSSKIHIMKDSLGILMSRTFRSPKSFKSPHSSCDTGIEDSLSSLSTSMSVLESFSSGAMIKPPLFPVDTNPSSLRPCYSEEDSGYSGPPSPFSSTCGSYLNIGPSCTPAASPSPRSESGSSLKASGSSFTSLQRKFMRNVVTSLESFSFMSLPDEDQHLPLYRTKLGLAILIKTKQENLKAERQLMDWLFNHQIVIESSINKLQNSLEMAYLHNSAFISTVYDSVAQFQQELGDLACAPRLQEPLWLSLFGATEATREKLYLSFVSKLLTAVLTHHLGWVSTVAPRVTIHPPSMVDGPHPNFQYNLANIFHRSQPYNALWSQLYELMGAICYPPRVTRTIVVGSDKTILSQLLVVLSYLIRCSQVEEKTFEKWKGTSNDSPESKFSINLERSVDESKVKISSKRVRESRKHGRFHEKIDEKSLEKLNRAKEDFLTSHFSTSINSQGTKKGLVVEAKNSGVQSQCKWMLNDKEIVTIDAVEPLKVQKESLIRKGLRTSKTVSALTQLDERVDFKKTLDKKLYPDLTKVEEAKLLSVDLEPSVIADKVSRLCRVPPGITKYTSKDSSMITAHGENIQLEVESGGKILFILGENERLEGLKPSEKIDCKPENITNDGRCGISSIPPPLDRLRIENFRRQGKSASALDERALSKKLPPMYPSIAFLEKELSWTGEPNIPKAHRRNFSDPTNGAFLLEMPPYFHHLGMVEEKGECCHPPLWHERITRESPSCDRLESAEASPEIMEVPRVEVDSTTFSPRVAESLFGGILDHYSSVFVVHATTCADKLKDQLKLDLVTTGQQPVLDPLISEAVAIVAEMGKWEIELVSSHSSATTKGSSMGFAPFPSYGGTPIMMSPLVTQITDALLNLMKLGTPSQFIIQCLDDHLRGVYLKSILLSQYLLDGSPMNLIQTGPQPFVGSKSLYNLSELVQTLGVDLDDLPLLLSVASTHTPVLTQMFGLTFK